MKMRINNITIDEASIVQRFRPLLVLYPEIPAGKERERNKDFPEVEPLNYDYHPRDIRIVLDHSSLHGTTIEKEENRERWQTMLDAMERDGYTRDINILGDAVSPSDRDEFWRRYGDIRKEDYPLRCYARLVRGTKARSNRVVVQYWYPYFYNDFWNTHEMDWELAMIVFKLEGSDLRPSVCACAGHHSGFWLPWREVEKANSLKERVPDGEHPIIYAANGSHANYFFGPASYATAAPAATMAASLLDDRIPIDYVTSFVRGSRQLVEAVVIPEPANGVWKGDWRWLNQNGLWGTPGKWLGFDFGDAGPSGPPRQRMKWETPFRWIDTVCKKAPKLADIMPPTLLEP
jgi:hypothetical protein